MRVSGLEFRLGKNFLYIIISVCNRTFYCGIYSHRSEWVVINFTNFRRYLFYQSSPYR